MNKDEDFDFGFTFTTEDEIASVDDTKNKLEQMRKLIMPLLKNLKKNPDKEMIKWPDRAKAIDAMIAKIDKIVEG